MTLKEFYTLTGGDYEGTMARLITEARVKKFAHKFKDDISFSQLCSAVEEGDVKSAFMAAHTLKGVSQNLGFEPLYRAAAAVTEITRSGSLELGSLMDELKIHYATIIDALATLEE